MNQLALEQAMQTINALNGAQTILGDKVTQPIRAFCHLKVIVVEIDRISWLGRSEKMVNS